MFTNDDKLHFFDYCKLNNVGYFKQSTRYVNIELKTLHEKFTKNNEKYFSLYTKSNTALESLKCSGICEGTL